MSILSFLDDTRKAVEDAKNNIQKGIDSIVTDKLASNQSGVTQTRNVETVVTSSPTQTAPKGGLEPIANIFGISTQQLLLGVGAIVVIVVVMRLRK